MLALYAGALDRRIAAVCISGYFDSRQNVWQEPLDRNVFGLLEQFGDAELASMIAPRRLVIEAAGGRSASCPPGTGGGPGRLVTPKLDGRATRGRRGPGDCWNGMNPPPRIDLIVCGDGSGPSGSDGALQAFLDALGIGRRLAGPAAAAPVAWRPCRMPRPGRPGNSTRSIATTSSCSWKARTCGSSSSRSSIRVPPRRFARASSPIASTSTRR